MPWSRRRTIVESIPLAGKSLDELEAHVQCCLGGRIQDFRLAFQEGGLILRGQTHSYYVKQLTQHHVLELADLPIRANDIEVM